MTWTTCQLGAVLNVKRGVDLPSITGIETALRRVK